MNVVWKHSGVVEYGDATRFMDEYVNAIIHDNAPDMVWLLEHPHLFTYGTSAKPEELLEKRYPVYESRRGGKFTYHGPGQRIIYVMMNLNRSGKDVRRFVCSLEKWIIATLSDFDVTAQRNSDHVGVWVPRLDGQDKIASVGIHLRKWVSYHGLSLNVQTDMENFKSIIPCGIKDERYGVTSLKELGLDVTMEDVDKRLVHNYDVVNREGVTS